MSLTSTACVQLKAQESDVDQCVEAMRVKLDAINEKAPDLGDAIFAEMMRHVVLFYSAEHDID